MVKEMESNTELVTGGITCMAVGGNILMDLQGGILDAENSIKVSLTK